MVDQAAKNGVIERRSMVENVQQWVVIDKETKDAAYTYLHKATNALAYIPLVIMALPVVGFAMLVAANVGIFVLFPLAVWWGAFAYWFPARAQQVADLLKRAYDLLKEYWAKALALLTWAYTQPGEVYAAAKDFVVGLFSSGSKRAQDAAANGAAPAKSAIAGAKAAVSSQYDQASELAQSYSNRAVEFAARVYSAVADFVSNSWQNVLTFVLRVRETVRALLWDNLRTPSTFNGQPLAPFFPELIESTAEFLSGGSGSIPQAADLKNMLAAYLPERVTRNIKDF